MSSALRRAPNQFALSAFWFAWEMHWAALLGAALQAQVAHFIEPGFTGRAMGILSGAGALFSIVSQYAAGRASDVRRRRIPFIAVGTLCNIVALFGFAVAPSFVTVVAAFVGVQVAFNIAGGPYQALIPDHVTRERLGWASGVMALYRLAGNAAGLLLARAIVKQPGPGVSGAVMMHSLVLLAAALSVVLVIALVVTMIGVPDTPSPSADTDVAVAWPQRRSFTWLVVSRALVSMGLYLILPFFAFFLRFSLGVGDYLKTSLTLLLTINLCSLAGTLPAGFLGDRLAKKSIMFGAFALLAVGAVLLANAGSTSGLLPLAVMLGIGWGAYYAVDWALACSLLPPGRAGALMALWNIGASGPQVLSPAIGGLLVDRIGAAQGQLGAGYRVLFDLVAVYVVLGAAALAFVREPRGGKAGNTG